MAPGSAARTDAAILVGLLAWTAFSLRAVDLSAPPYEDAAMLLRYSEHVADGLGIVWNPGEHPVDGATDFLFMLMVAALKRAGAEAVAAARLLGLTAHLAAVAAVYLGIRRLSPAPAWFAAWAAAWLGAGTGVAYIAAGFGTPVFALSACLMAALAIRIDRVGETWRRAAVFAVLALATGLIRPDGAALAGMSWLGLVLGSREPRRKTILAFLAVFGLAGGAYFLWRWSLFGYPLPNPAYVKASRLPLIQAIGVSTSRLRELGLAPCLLFAYSIWPAPRRTLSYALPVCAYIAMWCLMADDTNYKARFQYAVLPMILIAGPAAGWPSLRPLWDRAWAALTSAQRTAAIAVALAWAAISLQQQQFAASYEPASPGIPAAAAVLRDYRGQNWTLGTTEAGLLPLISGWRSIDTWGLNDSHIAHRGLDAAYLDRSRPAILMFNGVYAPLAAEDDHAWNRMNATLRSYAEARDYCLLFAYGESPHRHVHHYYIRGDIAAGYPDLLARLRSIPYRAGYMIAGVPSVDFADGSPRACPAAP